MRWVPCEGVSHGEVGQSAFCAGLGRHVLQILGLRLHDRKRCARPRNWVGYR